MIDPAQFLKRYRVDDGSRFRLSRIDPADTAGLGDTAKEEAKQVVQLSTTRLAELQDKLYAQDCWALLLIFQAMDAAGKDGTIKHVMTGINPQGCQVYSFKQPSAEELDHDYLWRSAVRLPERGRIGIFNRSYYEDVLVVRVHPEILASQRLPKKLVTKDIWRQRFKDINNFERHLSHNGTVIRKFYLHVSRSEQRKRFLKRLDAPEKNWKFSIADAEERRHWKSYMKAYEDAIRHTASREAPWYVIPADNKWFTRMMVSAAVIEALESLNLKYPTLDKQRRDQLEAARTLLEK